MGKQSSSACPRQGGNGDLVLLIAGVPGPDGDNRLFVCTASTLVRVHGCKPRCTGKSASRAVPAPHAHEGRVAHQWARDWRTLSCGAEGSASERATATKQQQGATHDGAVQAWRCSNARLAGLASSAASAGDARQNSPLGVCAWGPSMPEPVPQPTRSIHSHLRWRASSPTLSSGQPRLAGSSQVC